MAIATVSALSDGFKRIYTKDRMERLTFEDNPFLAAILKADDFIGEDLAIPVIVGNPQGRSAAIADAITGKSVSQIKRFILTRVQDYGAVDLGREAMLASRSNEGAFMQVKTLEMDGIIAALSNSLSRALFGNGGGSIGRVNNSGFATTALDLVKDSDAVNFEINQILELASADGTSGAVRTGSLTVTAVDHDASSNQVTTSADLSTGVAAIAQNDFIFANGDFGIKVVGMDGWIPSSAPGATTFFGLDRTVSIARLSGLRLDGSTLPVKETLIKAASKLARFNSTPDHAVVSYTTLENLSLELGTQVVRDQLQADGPFNFETIQLRTANGIVKIFADRSCPNGVGWMYKARHLKLHHLSGIPHIFQDDGLLARNSTTDSYELRAGYYANLAINAPISACHLTFAT